MLNKLRSLLKFFFLGTKRRDIIFSLIMTVISIVIYFLPTGFEDRQLHVTEKVKGKIIATNNSAVEQHGLLKTGGQMLEIEIMEGSQKGRRITSYNQFLGKLELDKFFEPGDYALVNVSVEGNTISWATASDHYRLNAELLLVGIFIVFLLCYGGFTGFQAVLSFVFTALCLWKILVPLLLEGYDPIYITMIIVMVLAAVILFLVAGLNKKGLVAFIGASLGFILTCIIALSFAAPLKLSGTVRPFSETLLYSGYTHLNLNRIFLSGIFLAASGAVMDLAMDISAAMNEILVHNPAVSRLGLLKSGVMVGRAVIGSMTTTLILAYSGGYLTMLMLFMGQGIPMENILNMNYISSEILHTIAGSLGLVLVAPITAVIGCVFYKSKYFQ